VSKELPRVTDKLRKAIAEWEEEAREPFIYLGYGSDCPFKS
jgi:hypothetical protein